MPKVVELQLEEVEARPDLDRTRGVRAVAADRFIAAIALRGRSVSRSAAAVGRHTNVDAAIAVSAPVASPPPALPPTPARLSPGRIIRKD